MTDLDEPIATIGRGERGEIRIARKTYNGSPPYVDVRSWYYDEHTGDLRPGKGVTLRMGELREVAHALQGVAGGDERRRPAHRAQRDERQPTGQLIAGAE